jgi:MYXO-CTERM domain-containing protein
MRKTIAVVSATGALLFGGAGVANATVSGAPVPSSTTTTLADNGTDNKSEQHSDKTGLWGLLGLLGLGGLAGLKRRNDTDATVVAPAAGRGRVQ